MYILKKIISQGIVREFGMDKYTLLSLKKIKDKVLLNSTGKSINDMCEPGWEGFGVRMET